MKELPSCIVILEKDGKKYTKYVNNKRIKEFELKKPVFVEPPPKKPEITPHISNQVYIYYSIGDFQDKGPVMTNIGLDIGTKTIALSFRNTDNSVSIIHEINGYWLFERPSPFIERMLDDPSKKRSDGTARAAKWIKLPSTGQICVLGHDGEEFAYANNDTLRRPMAEGGITPDEESMTVLSSIINGLLETAEKDLGSFDKELTICYCTTAQAINKELNISYHQKVIDVILNNYKTKSKLKLSTITESHAIVINESMDGTGIGISMGAGTATISYCVYGLVVYSFSIVGSGDWIDTQVAMRHGYDVNASLARKKTARETPTTVCKRKHEISLMPGKEPTDRVGFDIVLHYDVLIDNIVDNIINGFNEHAAEARVNEGINIYIAGGTSSPDGFEQRFEKRLKSRDLPFSIGTVTKSANPLFCVAEGCLKAAEAGM